MTISIFKSNFIAKFSLAFVFALGFVFFVANDALAGTAIIYAINHTDYPTGTSYQYAVQADPGDTIRFRLAYIGGNPEVSSFRVVLPSDLTFVSGSTTKESPSYPDPSPSANGQEITWTFNSVGTILFNFKATVSSGSTLSKNHTLSIPFYVGSSQTESDSARVITGPIVTSITPSSGHNTDGTPITIKAHGLTQVAEITQILLSGIADEIDLGAASLSGPDVDNLYSISGISVPGGLATGSYFIALKVTKSYSYKSNTYNFVFTTAANSSESAAFTVSDGTFPTMSTGSNTYVDTDSSGVLTLNFDETIDASATDLSKITISNASNGGDSTVLTGSTVSTADATQIQITLSQSLKNTIARWGIGASNLYVQIADSGIYDTSGNALQAQVFRTKLDTWTKDTQVPTFSNFSITQSGASTTNVKAGIINISLTLSEIASTTPQISINQAGEENISAASMTDAGSNVYTYEYTVNASSTPAYLDGLATITISAAQDYAGNTMASDSTHTFTIDTSGPTAPENMSVAAAGKTAATFSWQGTYAESDFGTYEVKYADVASLAGATTFTKLSSGYGSLGSSAAASAAISSLSPGTTYYFSIRTCDASNNCSAWTSAVSATTDQSNPVVIVSPGGGGGGTAPAATPTASASRTIGADGGSLTTTLSSGSSAKLEFSPNALSANLNVTVTEASANEIQASPVESSVGSFVGNNVYEIAAQEGSTYITQFSEPVVLTFSYTAPQIGSAGTTANLRIAYFDASAKKWVPLNSTVNPDMGTVTASTNHFTLFALINFTEIPDTGTIEPEDNGAVLGGSVGVYPNGSLLKAPDSAAVWLIAGDQKHLIKSGEIFVSRFKWDDIIKLPSSRQLDLYEPGEDVKFAAGKLVKEAGAPDVYRVSLAGGRAPIISGGIFISRGYEFRDIIEVETGFLAGYNIEPMIDDSNLVLDGDLFKTADNSAVYFVENQKARLIPSEDIFKEHAFKFKNVRTITAVKLAEIGAGANMTYPDGTLIKGNNSAVYVISDGRKRPIVSGSDFEALLYNWDNIRFVPEDMLSQIPLSSLPVRLVQGGVNVTSK